MLEKLKAYWGRVKLYFAERRIILAIALAVAIAFFMTCMGLWIYDINDVSRLDISRPGYENVRKQSITRQEDTRFLSDGAITEKTMVEFQKLFDEKRKAMSGLGQFNDDALSDEQLKIVPVPSN